MGWLFLMALVFGGLWGLSGNRSHANYYEGENSYDCDYDCGCDYDGGE